MEKRAMKLLICFWVIITEVLCNTTEPISTATSGDCGNGKSQCSNGSNLVYGTACDSEKQMRCDDGGCIPEDFICDGMDDCLDGSDEKDCYDSRDLCGRNCYYGNCRRGRKNRYKCECDEGIEGKRCDIVSWCKKNQDSVCGKNKNVYCDLDYYVKSGACKCIRNDQHFNAKTKTCKALDECSKLLFKGECRKPHQYCVDGECKCEDKYRFSNGVCVPNVCNEDTCGRRGICKDIGNGAYRCECEKNYFLLQNGTCEKINLCSPGISQCEQTCDEHDGSCGCFSGFALRSDNKTCKKNPGQRPCSKYCGSFECLGDKCLCPYVTHVPLGNNCIDRCTADQLLPGTCPENNCKKHQKFGFVCECDGIYERASDGVHCERKNKCSESYSQFVCNLRNSTCVEKYDRYSLGYECKCRNKEYEEVNRICIHKCLNPEKVRECTDKLGVCELDTNNNAVCKCRPFMAKDVDGKCTKLAEYSYTGNFLLPKKFYQKSSNRDRNTVNPSLNLDIDLFTLKTDIEVSIKAFTDDIQEINILNCSREWMEYLNCSVELQMKRNSTEILHILSSGSVCHNIEWETQDDCLIPPRLLKYEKKTDFVETDPCNEDVKNKLCGYATKCKRLVEGKNFKCTCKDGFRSIGYYFLTADRNSSIEHCEDINECENRFACPDTTECVNEIGSYSCKCKNGFRRKARGDDPKHKGCVAVCDPNPCKHGECFPAGHNFTCNCIETYSGLLCDKQNKVIIDMKEKFHKTLFIIGGVLLASLVLKLIVGRVIYRRIKRKQMGHTEECRPQKIENPPICMKEWVPTNINTPTAPQVVNADGTTSGGDYVRGIYPSLDLRHA